MNEQQFRSRKGQERTALLALSAHSPKKSGACLSSELITALVEERCPADERETSLAHLASCDRCYREWLTINTLHKQRTTRGTVLQFVTRPRNLAAAGSLLAAAASVVLYLNIRYPESHQVLQEKAAEPVLELELKDAEQDLFKEDTPIPTDMTEPLGKAEYSTSTASDEDAESASPAPVEIPASLSEAKPLTRQRQPITPQLEEAPVRKARAFSTTERKLSFATWQQDIAAGCRDEEKAPGFWDARVKAGELLLQDQLEDHDRAMVEEIVTFLKTRSPDDGLDGFCSKYLELIDR